MHYHGEQQLHHNSIKIYGITMASVKVSKASQISTALFPL